MAADTRTRMLAATARLLRQRGYHGTSLNDILAASGAPRGSLYFHFPGGKDQIVIEVTRTGIAEISERIGQTLAQAATPAMAVRRMVEATAAALGANEYALGCPVAPVVLDGMTEIPELLELCRQAFAEWIGLMRAAFVRGGIPAARAASLALLVESAIEGMIVVTRASRHNRPMQAVAEELAALLESAVERPDAQAAS